MLLWNLEETAKQLGNISPRTVQRLIQRGELTVVRVGRCVRCKRTHGLRQSLTTIPPFSSTQRRLPPLSLRKRLPAELGGRRIRRGVTL